MQKRRKVNKGKTGKKLHMPCALILENVPISLQLLSHFFDVPLMFREKGRRQEESKQRNIKGTAAYIEEVTRNRMRQGHGSRTSLNGTVQGELFLRCRRERWSKRGAEGVKRVSGVGEEYLSC